MALEAIRSPCTALQALCRRVLGVVVQVPSGALSKELPLEAPIFEEII